MSFIVNEDAPNDTWYGSVEYYLYNLWKGEVPANKVPQINFNGIILRRISDQDGYAILGTNSIPSDETFLAPFAQTLYVSANSAADVEVGLKRFQKNPTIRLLTLVFVARPHLLLPAGKLDIWKVGDDIRLYAEGILPEMPSPMSDGNTHLHLERP